MKFGVIVFPGSNCDDDAVYTFQDVLGQQVVKLWHKSHDLQGCDFIVLPGGFSYGDYLRSGAIAGFSPIMEQVIAHANQGGYVLGICNGFQILTEAKLLPGALLHNISQQFVCKNTYLKPVSRRSSLTSGLDIDRTYKIPVAHAEGRFYAPDDTVKQLEDNDQILFRYSHADGEVDEAANFNGSIKNIAGIMNEGGNVFGMMPHPERAADETLGNTDGKLILENLLKHIK